MKNNKKKRVQKACELLSVLKKLKPNQCQELFSNFSNNGIEFFCEIIYNLINAKFNMSKQKIPIVCMCHCVDIIQFGSG